MNIVGAPDSCLRPFYNSDEMDSGPLPKVDVCRQQIMKVKWRTDNLGAQNIHSRMPARAVPVLRGFLLFIELSLLLVPMRVLPRAV